MHKRNSSAALAALLLSSAWLLAGCGQATVRPQVNTTQSATWEYAWQSDGVVIPSDALREYNWLLERYGARVVPPYKAGYGVILEFADGRAKITYDALKLWLQLLGMHDRAQVHR